MNVLIVEDETAAATNLKALLLQIDPSIRIEAVIETVVETVPLGKGQSPARSDFYGYSSGGRTGFQDFRADRHRMPDRFHDRVRPLCARCFQGQQHRLHSQTDQERGASPAFDKLRRLSAPQVAEYVEQTNRFVTSRSRGFLIPFRDKLVPLTPEEIAYFHTSDERVSVATLDGRTLRWTGLWIR